MKYLVGGGGWPIGGVLIPAGTLIDLPDDKPEYLLSPWERLAMGRVPARDCVPLDKETLALMVEKFEKHGFHVARHLVSEAG
jgi:hypothetical protein